MSLSEQQLVSCDTELSNNGCNGGWPFLATVFLYHNQAVLESNYPYVSGNGTVPECHHISERVPVDISGAGFVWMDEENLKNALLTYGPISIGIDATAEFVDYSASDGVFFDTTCKEVGANHAVLLVGYGTLEGQDYWLVKNSWGEDWGLDGYILMARNNNNMCGVATAALYIY